MSIPNRIQAHWAKARDFIRAEWPQISHTALEDMNGSYDLLLKYIKVTYNNFPLEEAKARDKIQQFINKLEEAEK